MKKCFFIFFFSLIFLLNFGFGQSLAEVAEKEKKRRKNIKQKVTVITNENLGKNRIKNSYGFISVKGNIELFDESKKNIIRKFNEEEKQYKDLKEKLKKINGSLEQVNKNINIIQNNIRSNKYNYLRSGNPVFYKKMQEQQEKLPELKKQQQELENNKSNLVNQVKNLGITENYLNRELSKENSED